MFEQERFAYITLIIRDQVYLFWLLNKFSECTVDDINGLRKLAKWIIKGDDGCKKDAMKLFLIVICTYVSSWKTYQSKMKKLLVAVVRIYCVSSVRRYFEKQTQYLIKRCRREKHFTKRWTLEINKTIFNRQC